MSTVAYPVENESCDLVLTRHAWEQMCRRSISSAVVQNVLEYGRAVYVRGAQIFAIGRKEVKRCLKMGIDLSESEGVQVVCAVEGAIMTTYRNNDFRSLRPGRRQKKSV